MMKLRAVRAELRQLGFEVRQGRGSHEVWTHAGPPHRRIVLSGTNGEDVKPYQLTKMRKFRRGTMVYEQKGREELFIGRHAST